MSNIVVGCLEKFSFPTQTVLDRRLLPRFRCQHHSLLDDPMSEKTSMGLLMPPQVRLRLRYHSLTHQNRFQYKVFFVVPAEKSKDEARDE